MKLRYLSLCSGMECASLAWEPLGWECVAVAEIDKDACKLLNHRLPHVPNLGDLTKIDAFDIECLGPIDVVIGGMPCQSVSMAGKREGFFHEDGTPTRSGLFHTGLQIARWSGARYFLYENVLGLFSSNQGRDFAGVVADMAGLAYFDPPVNGWGQEGAAVGDNGLVEWVTLDSQFFGLAQRRKRVFALLDIGDWSNRPPILLERESLRGAAPTRREAREEDAGGVEEGAGSGECGGVVDCYPLHPHAIGRKDEAGPQAKHWSEDGVAYTMDTKAPQAVAYSIDDNHTSGTEIFGTMQARKGSGGSWMTVCYGGGNTSGPIDSATTLLSKWHGDFETETLVMHQNYVVRKITPIEAERLQGVDDNYTLVPGVSETARYKMLGNGFSVPVIRWIGERIEMALQFKAG